MNITAFNCHNVEKISFTAPALLDNCGGAYHADIIIKFDDGTSLTVTTFSNFPDNLVPVGSQK